MREIRGFATDGGQSIFLGTYLADSWYKVRIRYQIVDAQTVRLTYWIDDEFRGREDWPAISNEGNLSYLGIDSNEGTAWFDDVKVTHMETVKAELLGLKPSRGGNSGSTTITIATSGLNFSSTPVVKLAKDGEGEIFGQSVTVEGDDITAEFDLSGRSVGRWDLVVIDASSNESELSEVFTVETCVQPPAGIVAWWPFDEASGSIAADISGENPGVYFGAPVPAPGQVGEALRFDASAPGSFVGVADNDLWAFGFQDFTIELWTNFATPGGGSIGEPSHIFIGNDEGPGTRNKWFFALGGGFLNFHINGPDLGPQFFPRAPFAPARGQWYHLAVTRSGSLYRLFVDGVSVASAVNSAEIPNPGAFLTIGQAENLGFMRGLLDEVTIYNRALTEVELREIATAGSAGKCKGTSGNGLQITSVNPNVGGNAGDVTVTIKGDGFLPGAVVELVGGSALTGRSVAEPILRGVDTIVAPNVIQTTFNLHGQPPQELNVQVTNGNDTATLAPEQFTIQDGGEGRVLIDIAGPRTVRAGREAIFYIIAQNKGTIDTWVTIQSTLQIPNKPPLEPDLTPLPAVEVPTGVDVPIEVPFTVPLNSQGCGNFNASIAVIPPLPAPGNPNPCPQLRARAEALRDLTFNLENILAEWADRYYADECDNPLLLFTNRVKSAWCQLLKKHIDSLRSKIWQLRRLLEITKELMRIHNCPPIDDLPNFIVPGMPSFIVPEVTNYQEVCAVTSWDPNDKNGPAGIGELRHISSTSIVPHTIFIENLQSATAPAQTIVIRDQLDRDLDWMTVSLGTIRLGSHLLYLEPGQRHVNALLDLRPTTDLVVEIEADVDTETGVVTWRFTSLEPSTGQMPSDPHAGFLPPNVNPPEGEGSVSFTVMPKRGLTTGIQIHNKATIVFDQNPPIDTPVVFNTIDSSPPESQVLSLAPEQFGTDFVVHWSGTDEGSGIKAYTILVSEDGGPLTEWLTHTAGMSATFSGLVSKSYAFYSVARDQVGNVEGIPTAADTTTKILPDECPGDPDKTVPGVCGCGIADTDSDGDETPDCRDACPVDSSKTAPGACGCGVADKDSDGDGVANCRDNCPTIANPDQKDSNGDGKGDSCTEQCGNCRDDNGDGLIDLNDPDCPASVLTLEKGVLALIPDPNEDKIALDGAFTGTVGSINPSAEGATVSLTDADGPITCFTLPAGQGWRVSNGPTWTFKDNKGEEKLRIEYDAKKRAFAIRVRIKETELTNPGAGSISTSLVIGEDRFLNIQAWRWKANGRKLATP